MDACCAPVCCEPLDEASALEMATTLKALADPTRLRLFSLVASQTQQCACDLTEPLGVSQPTVSHHLKILTEAGLLTREQRGKWAYFSVSTEAMRDLTNFLDPAAMVS